MAAHGETAAGRGPFPQRLTRLIGRAAELRDVSGALTRDRLVTLVGPAGSGKTRLALEAAREWSDRPKWYADMAYVEADAVASTLAAATGAPEGPGEEPLSAAMRRIGDTPGLLLLDTCDDLVATCAGAVDQLLGRCPHLVVLATSRSPLGVEGEQVYRVPPLSLPAGDEASDGEAVELFFERAGPVPGDRAVVRDICRRLDGLPLAIELAASRARSIPVTDVLDGLADRFRLLAGGPRTMDRRHRSLAASIEWSYRLLADEERALLQRIAVLRGPFTAEDARSVGGGDGVDGRDVLPMLADLVEQSFVAVGETQGRPWYRLLETIREYAAGELERDPDEAAAARDRHLRSRRELVEEIEARFDGPELLDHLARLEAQLADIRAAVAWAATTGNADDALRLVGALSWFWHVRRRRDGPEITAAALAIAGGEDRWRAKALYAATWAAVGRFDPGAPALGEEAVRLAASTGDTALLARAECFLGWACVFFAFPDANRHLRRACELAEEAGDEWGLTCASIVLVNTELAHLPEARRLAEAARARATANGYVLHGCGAQYVVAMVALMQGRLDDAETAATAALDAAELLGSTGDAMICRIWLAWVAALRGDPAGAGRHAVEAERAGDASGNAAYQILGRAAAGFAFLAGGHADKARDALAGAVPVAALVSGGAFGAGLAAAVADAARLAGDHDGARRHAGESRDLAEAAGADWGRSHAALAATRTALVDGDIAGAADAAHCALTLARANEDDVTVVDALEAVAEIETRRGAFETAGRLLGAAAAARARMGYHGRGLHSSAAEETVRALLPHLDGDALERVRAEGARLSPGEAAELAGRRRGSRQRPPAGWDALTPAERRVVDLVAEGLTNAQIAERLFVTANTVKGHISSALRKTGLANRAELAAGAVRRAPSGPA